MDPSTRRRINSLISPWRAPTHDAQPVGPPPFSIRELVVFALALSDESLTESEITTWITRTCRFYSRIGARGVWARFQEEESPARPWLSSFQRLTASWDFPATSAEVAVSEVEWVDGVGEMRQVRKEYTVTKWTLRPNEARSFLRPLLWPDEQLKGPFPFLDLPADIRNIVYTLVFSYPPTGVQINTHCRDYSGAAYVASRSFSQPFSFQPWLHRENHLDIGRLSSIMALTTTNRQIRSETLHFFASLNAFVFASATHMLDILRRMPADQREEIRSVAFFHHPGSGSVRAVPEIFEIFGTMKRLRKVRMSLDPWGFQRGYRYVHEGRVAETTGFDFAPGIGEDIELVVEGDWEGEVERAIRAKALPKPEVMGTDWDSRPPVEKWWSIWCLVWALSLAPVGICIVLLIYTATLLHHSPHIATHSTFIAPQTPLP